MSQKENNIQWQPIIEMVIVLMTILGSTIPLYLHTSGQIEAIHQEMMDFHGRMERQDAEFKGKMALQDAEFKAKLASQDAEFKIHLLLHHHDENNRKDE